jgi:cobalamin biosynthesis Co2+ chelatase CbiK
MEQSFVNALFGGIMALLGWLGKTLWDAVQDLKQDVKEIEINLPKDYVGKNDYKEDVREIKDMLKQLFEHFHKER